MSTLAQRQPFPYVRTITAMLVLAGVLWIASGVLLFAQFDNLTPRGLAIFIGLIASTDTVSAVQLWCLGHAESRQGHTLAQVGNFYQADRGALARVVGSAAAIPRSDVTSTQPIPKPILVEPPVTEERAGRLYDLGRRAERARLLDSSV